jgi:hypothetical protein
MDTDKQFFQLHKKGQEDIVKALEKQTKVSVVINKKDIDPDVYTPKKGKDYFTKTEQDEFVKEIMSKIRIPVDGKDGSPGKDAEPVDYSRIEKFVIKEVAKIPKPQDPTPIDIDSVIVTVLEKMPKQKAIKVDYKKIEDFCLEAIKKIEDHRESRVRTLNSGGPTTRLWEISDVNVDNVQVGQVLSWNGSAWVPKTDADSQNLQQVTDNGATTTNVITVKAQPTFTYSSGVLSNIAYSNGTTKAITYNLDGTLNTLTTVYPDLTTITKTMNWVAGQLISISVV